MRGRFVCCVGSALLISVSGCSGDGGAGPDPANPGSIAGRVTAGTTNVSAASIALSGGATRTATTDAAGEYRFDGLNAGAYNVALTVPTGFQLPTTETLSKPTTVAAGQTATINWSLESAGNDGVPEVRLNGASFEPAELKIKVGETVKFVGVAGQHTVTPDDPNQAGVWTGFNLGAGQTREVTFTTAGTFPYHCIPHAPSMVGTIIVEA